MRLRLTKTVARDKPENDALRGWRTKLPTRASPENRDNPERNQTPLDPEKFIFTALSGPGA
jgi:hypothetical protein